MQKVRNLDTDKRGHKEDRRRLFEACCSSSGSIEMFILRRLEKKKEAA